jgi:hypothetical protein
MVPEIYALPMVLTPAAATTPLVLTSTTLPLPAAEISGGHVAAAPPLEGAAP